MKDPFADLTDLLLADDSELKEQLDALFGDPVDFLDRESMKRIGFERGKGWSHFEGRLLWVLRHPALPHHLIKTFPLVGDGAPFSARLPLYLRRMGHARQLRAYIAAGGMDRVVVAEKRLYRLPSQFCDELAPYGRAVMVVDRFDLLDRRGCQEAYLQLDRESVRQLVELWVCVGGFEGLLQNMPITVDAKIALVDTQLGGHHKEPTPPRLLSLLTTEMGEYAVEVAKELGR